jgi:hypothetical protein
MKPSKTIEGELDELKKERDKIEKSMEPLKDKISRLEVEHRREINQPCVGKCWKEVYKDQTIYYKCIGLATDDAVLKFAVVKENEYNVQISDTTYYWLSNLGNVEQITLGVFNKAVKRVMGKLKISL